MHPTTKPLSHFPNVCKTFYNLLCGSPSGRLSKEHADIVKRNWFKLEECIEPRLFGYIAEGEDTDATEKNWVITSDASDVGCGSALYLVAGELKKITVKTVWNMENWVGLMSHVFGDNEKRWPTYDQELYSIILSLRKFGGYQEEDQLS